MTLERVTETTRAAHLDVFGALHDGPDTVVLLGPHEPGFWAMFSQSPEKQDNQPDPMDRWSKRVISGLAQTLDATAEFPFGGPPYAPFLQWAVDSGRAWSSPVGMLVQERAGLMVSYRGALRFNGHLLLPAPAQIPCEDCVQPCVSACPVDALSADGYNVQACKQHIASPAGESCLKDGCLARRACPISRDYGRLPAQSGFHMASFLGA